MEIKDEHIELIAKYLSGQATETEAEELLQWVRSAPEHEQLFKQYARDWQRHHFIPSDPSKLWAQFSQKAGLNRRFLKVERRVLMRAAAFFLLALLSAYTALYLLKDDQQILVAENEVKNFTLPDGSVLVLAPSSSAIYSSREFNQHIRKIQITGMARLEVKHDEQAPFEAMAGKLQIRVTGTRFYVSSGDETLMPSVYLEEGRVEASLAGHPDNRMVLKPGQQAGIDPLSGKLSISDRPDVNQSAWLTRHFEFDATPLFKVIWLLQKTYSIEVELVNPGIGNCTLTATFDNQSPEDILRIIAATLGLQVSGSQRHFVLSGNSCP
ncbi:MAG: FecR family protein [Bacteroidales bacterium]